MDFSVRSSLPELMDTETVSDADFAHCLRDLATVNSITLAHRPTVAFLDAATRDLPRGTRLTLLDVGSGHGDMLRAIADWGHVRGLALTLAGIDLNPASAPAARAATSPSLGITYLTGDVFAYRPGHVDFVVSSLFTHHLSDPVLEDFIAWMEHHAARGWFINDLYRSRFAYHGFALLARVAGWHRFVRHDGPVSIARSFRPADWRARLGGIPARVERQFPYRLCVSRLR